MAESKTERYARDVAEPVIEAHGYRIYDLEYVKEGPHWFLRVYVDSDNGVRLDDCEAISRALSDALDRDSQIKEAYFLEVSSPGVERLLRRSEHFDRVIGSRVRILQKDGKAFEGVLVSHTADAVLLEEHGAIQKSGVKRANLVFDFSEY